jgi:hypothetical protein
LLLYRFDSCLRNFYVDPARPFRAKEHIIEISEPDEVGRISPVTLWTSTDETAVLGGRCPGRRPAYRNRMLLFEGTTVI